MPFWRRSETLIERPDMRATLEIRPMEIVLDGWRVYVDRTGKTVAVSSPEKPAEIPFTASRVYVSPADYEAMKLDVLRPSN